MFQKKNYIVVGLTTFHTEFLRISVPPLAKLPQNIFLIVHNDNPNASVTKSDIRKLGYRGPLHVINVERNGGPLQARLNILAAIPKLRIQSDWMIFANDDDLLVDTEIPIVKDSNFAVMQNMVFIKKRILDLLKVMDNPKNYIIDNFHITMERPHIGIVGTLLRTDMMIQVGKLIQPIMPNILVIDSTLGTRAPEDIVMWFYLQMYAKQLNPDAEPIYMDKTNYIAVTLDFSPQKYGQNLIPDDQPTEYYDKSMQRYRDLFQEQLMDLAATKVAR
ncbi:MAG: hypothetical protein LBF37_00955 [Rickettsiales bacterium]|nr:hypothetical protein [Rickettsiales bacterium]